MELKESRILPRETYLGAPDSVARLLLGKLLVRRQGNATMAGRIVETEAYFGLDDPAAHAFAGRTARTEVLYGPPGHAYVYLIYGLHACLNVSCEPEGQAGCVLIRALEPITGLGDMAANRKVASVTRPGVLTGGPGRLCQALAITRTDHNGMDLVSPASNLQIRADSYVAEEVDVTPRIGITKAADRLLRFTLAGHACLSRR